MLCGQLGDGPVPASASDAKSCHPNPEPCASALPYRRLPSDRLVWMPPEKVSICHEMDRDVVLRCRTMLYLMRIVKFSASGGLTTPSIGCTRQITLRSP